LQRQHPCQRLEETSRAFGEREALPEETRRALALWMLGGGDRHSVMSLDERSEAMFRGFRDFILRGNVLDLAVAVVLGVAFGAVVNSVVKNLITPLIALAGGVPDFSAIRTGPLLWGNILNDVLTFLITAAVVYFVVVLPVSRVLARLQPSAPTPQPTRKCPECLSDIPVAARRCAYCTAQLSSAAP
jgi:large conductance mechanosensitive channel